MCNPHSLLSARKFFNWLDILLPDFPRDQIRAAEKITSRIQLILTYLSLMWENGESFKNPFSCMSSREPLFNCIIVNEVLMQLQERGPLYLSYHERRKPGLGSWNHPCSSSFKHTYRLSALTLVSLCPVRPPPSSSITHCHPTLSEKSSEVTWVCAFFRMQVGDAVIICLFLWLRNGRCTQGAFYHPTHFLD